MNKREWKMIGLGMVFALVVGTLMAQTYNANTKLIPFQARLTDQTGAAYPNGAYNMAFRIYGLPTGGAILWQESHTDVPVINGMFNVMLGSINSLVAISFHQPAYVGISINGAPEMAPRQMVMPSVYAHDAGLLNGLRAGNASGEVPINNGLVNLTLNADLLDGYHAGHNNGQVPVSDGTLNQNLYAARAVTFDQPGMIAMFAGTSCPSGWTPYAALDGRVPTGVAPAAWNDGLIGGADIHGHPIPSRTTNAAGGPGGGSRGADCNTSSCQLANDNHTHTTGSWNTSNASSWPPYKRLVFCMKN